MAEMEIGCGKPTGAVVDEPTKDEALEKGEEETKEVAMATARIGTKAPDFQAPAFHRGKFKQVKLSDYLDKWVVLCFYPGDFTFV
jgi:hypothetical protein